MFDIDEEYKYKYITVDDIWRIEKLINYDYLKTLSIKDLEKLFLHYAQGNGGEDSMIYAYMIQSFSYEYGDKNALGDSLTKTYDGNGKGIYEDYLTAFEEFTEDSKRKYFIHDIESSPEYADLYDPILNENGVSYGKYDWSGLEDELYDE